MQAGIAALLLACLVGGGARGEEPADEPPGPAREARPDPAAALIEHAEALYRDQRYAEALAEYRSAYRERQAPKLLYRLAQVHQRLGDAKEALDHYRRFLVAMTDDDEPLAADAERQIARLRPLVVQSGEPGGAKLPAGAKLVPVRYQLQSNHGVVAGGTVLLSLGYLPAFICGILFGLGSSQPALSWPLLVPIVGPLISGATSFSQSYSYGLGGPAWGLSWIFIDGAAQVAGLAMLIAGIRSKRQVPVLGKIQWAPWTARAGGGLTLSTRF
jgi:hypothetical protein